MKNSKSTERLNNYKIETNKIVPSIEELTYNLNKINSKHINIENIGKAYTNKVYKIYTSLESKGIDFWSDDFELREAILNHLQTKLYYGAVLLKYIDIEILKGKAKSLENKRISITKISKMQSEIEKINKIAAAIKEYDINNNLEDTLIEYFVMMPEEDEQIDLKASYEKMKENINEIGVTQISPKIDAFIKLAITQIEEQLNNKKGRQRTR